MKKIRKEHEKINLDFAYAAIKDYFEQTNNYYIRFFGAGEPTLAFDEMVKIYDFSKSLAKGDLKTELQTNGNFNESIRDWINKNVDILWLSFDGLPELQNKQRPTKSGGDSSDAIIPNIMYFVDSTKRDENKHFGIRATITNGNFNKQVEIVEYLHSLGVKHVCVSPSYASTANDGVPNPDVLEFSRRFVDAYKKAQEFGMSYQTHYIVNFFEEVTAYCRACVPAPHVTTDGYVSCCDWALFGEEYLPGVLQKLIYGKYDARSKAIIYSNETINEIKRRNVTDTLGEGSCKNCAALRHCAGGCVGKTIVLSGDLYKPSKKWCSAARYLFNELPRCGNPPSCPHS
ncbi:MAG: SPASM domain-containing protein [Defluviitaleaceae bacterium]|nr:SPASM domain-containing protein [Defluviitaleaceae bacterium]